MDIRRTIRVYKQTPQTDLSIEFFFAPDYAEQGNRPAILFFFGGGWRKGNIEQFRPYASRLATRGIVAGLVNYRVQQFHGTTADCAVADSRAAMRWLRKHADELGVDPKRVVSSGASAGGHLAAALGTGADLDILDGDNEDRTGSVKPQYMALFNPVIDLEQAKAYTDVFPDPEYRLAASPYHQFHESLPPTILFYGEQDKFYANGAKAFVQSAGEKNLDVTLYLAKGVGHGFFNHSPWLESTMATLEEFLDSHGLLEDAEPIEVPENASLLRIDAGAATAGR